MLRHNNIGWQGNFNHILRNLGLDGIDIGQRQQSMASQGNHSIIHRKAQGGRLDFDARVMSPAKALRLALAKSADRLLDLVLTVTTVEQISLAQGKLRDVAGSDGLLIVLDGAAGARGAAKFDMQFLAGLIEMQTTGFVKAAEAEPRPVTITDAAMVAPMLNAVMQGFDAELSEAWAEHRAPGFRFGDMVEDGRALALLLDAPEYDMFQLNVDLAEGAKAGRLTLILPVQPTIEEAVQGPGAQTGDMRSIRDHALEAPVTMDAIMARIKMPLNEICQLEGGDLLTVPAECLSKTELVAAGNHVVSEVLLGQMNGFRAVRFAPSRDMATPEAPAAKTRTGAADLSDATGGEVMEGHAIEIDATAADAPGAGKGPDAQSRVGAMGKQVLPVADQTRSDLSELDTMPEEV